MFKYFSIFAKCGCLFSFSFLFLYCSLQVYGFTQSLQNLSENQCQSVCKGDPRGNMCPSPNLPLGTPGTEKVPQQCRRIEQCCRAGLLWWWWREPSPGCWAVCHAALSAAPGGFPWGSSALQPAAQPPPSCEPCPPGAGSHCGLRVPIRPPPSARSPPACSGATQMRSTFTRPAGLREDPFSHRNATPPSSVTGRVCLWGFSLLLWQTWTEVMHFKKFLELPNFFSLL